MKERQVGEKILINCFDCDGLGYISSKPFTTEPEEEDSLGKTETICSHCKGLGKLEATSK